MTNGTCTKCGGPAYVGLHDVECDAACDRGEPLSNVRLAFCLDMTSLTPEERVSVIDAVGSMYGMPTPTVRFDGEGEYLRSPATSYDPEDLPATLIVTRLPSPRRLDY